MRCVLLYVQSGVFRENTFDVPRVRVRLYPRYGIYFTETEIDFIENTVQNYQQLSKSLVVRHLHGHNYGLVIYVR